MGEWRCKQGIVEIRNFVRIQIRKCAQVFMRNNNFSVEKIDV